MQENKFDYAEFFLNFLNFASCTQFHASADKKAFTFYACFIAGIQRKHL